MRTALVVSFNCETQEHKSEVLEHLSASQVTPGTLLITSNSEMYSGS